MVMQQISGSVGKHDWSVGVPGPDGYPVFVDDRQLSYRSTLDKAITCAFGILARLRVDGDYRLNDKPAGFMPPHLGGVRKETSLLELYALWEVLRDVPGTDDGVYLDAPFMHFESGTTRETVWRWFEERNRLFVAGEVMRGIRVTDEPVLMADFDSVVFAKGKSTRILAVLQPQKEERNYSVDIEGRLAVDATDKVFSLSLAQIHELVDDDNSTNRLVDPAELGHEGPYRVAITDQVCAFFAVENLRDITAEHLLMAKGLKPVVMPSSLSGRLNISTNTHGEIRVSVGDADFWTADEAAFISRLNDLIDAATEDAINAGCLAVQNALGIDSGDLAGRFFADSDACAGVARQIAAYALAEFTEKAFNNG